MKRLTYLFLFTAVFYSVLAQNPNKKTLDHSVYKDWKSVSKSVISSDGAFVSWEINPQQGDGALYLYRTEKDHTIQFPRANNARFSYQSDLIAFRINPQSDTIRKMKFAKVKKDKLPKDSLGIYIFSIDSLIKIADLKSFKMAEEGSSWIAYLLEKTEPKEIQSEKADSLLSKAEKEELKKLNKKLKKQLNTHLHILNPLTSEEVIFKHVKDYSVSKNGTIFLVKTMIKDSVDSLSIIIFNSLNVSSHELIKTAGDIKDFAVDEMGKQVAFIMSEDTSEIKNYSLYYAAASADKKAKKIVDVNNKHMPEGWNVSEHSNLSFSRNAKRIFFETVPILPAEPEDSLLVEEKYSVDIWHWQDKRLQSQQIKSLEKDLKKNYRAVYFTDKKKMLQLATEDVERVGIFDHGNGRYALGYSRTKYQKAYSWSGSHYFDGYLIDLKTGKRTLILEKEESSISISPAGKYVYWYAASDSSWYAYLIQKGIKTKLSAAIPFPVYQEIHDVPSNPRPYGIASWTENDEFILIYDRFDIWKINPIHPHNASNLCNSFGRNNKTRLRYVKLDKEEDYLIQGQDLVLSAFDEESKKSGYFQLQGMEESDPEILIFDDYKISYLKRSGKANTYCWYKSSFTECPEIYISLDHFKTILKLSDANPQQDDYLWGSVEIIKWEMDDGVENQGLLYKPENFDPQKKYPMIVYYYERYTDGLHNYYPPKPSHSVISFPLFTSNGYLVFIPDIHYTKGYPGKSALKTVLSGTNYLLESGFVDKDKLGLQGQSWGGYQTAYIVTQTNLFACAMAGAVVSNMTSAFGGIRWESGRSRMFQYEAGQSRIGSSIWENLDLYIENSPLFYADQVNTPVLLMHNDKDGAVPWYQGIEFFVALRRLEKPAWMLTYNKEAHNLRKWPNRMDLSIRMSQFFDHYLKDQAPPEWMIEGIPATKKGKKSGYELIKKEP